MKRLEFYRRTEQALLTSITNWKQSLHALDQILLDGAGHPDVYLQFQESQRADALRQWVCSQLIADKIYLSEIRLLIAEEQSHAR